MKNNNIYSKDNIVLHLMDIKKSIENDIGMAITLYMDYFFKTNKGIGFFAIPRMIFPEIDNLGSYYAGEIKNTPQNSIHFMKDYFTRSNPEYLRKGAFIYYVYRHGLMHQHSPKFISYEGENIGWAIHLSNKGVASNNLKLFGRTVQIDGRMLYEDLLVAIDFYIKDIENDDSKLINNFITAHKEMNKPISKTEVLSRYSAYIKKMIWSF